jgi:hypothetical protein
LTFNAKLFDDCYKDWFPLGACTSTRKRFRSFSIMCHMFNNIFLVQWSSFKYTFLRAQLMPLDFSSINRPTTTTTWLWYSV